MLRKVLGTTVVWAGVMLNMLLAEEFTWNEISGEGFGFQVLLVDSRVNRVIFAGQSGNLLKSDDSGKIWRRVLSLRGNLSGINDLVADGKNPNLVYAATDKGLYRSYNSGERWERIFRGKNDQESRCSALGVGEKVLILGTRAGIFMSADQGRNWYKQNGGIKDQAVYNIDSSLCQNKIFYLSAESGIFKSLDNGQTWERVFVDFLKKEPEEDLSDSDNSDLSEDAFNNYFVKVDKNQPDRVCFSSSSGIFESLNQGRSWEKMTEYGLLERKVRMFCFSEGGGIFALTGSGVFFHANGRWQEASFSLPADKLNYLVLDNSGNLYVAGKKGIYKSSRKSASDFTGASLDEDYLKNEPSIKDLQKAAIEYAEVSSEKIAQWRKGASRKAFLPQVSVGLDRNSTDLLHWESGSSTKNEDDILRRGQDTVDWDVSLSWDLGDLIWNDAQTSIDVRSKLMVELREDILDQVNKLYFERLRVKSELDHLALEDRNKRFEKQLKLKELAASLDALTCGYYTNRLQAFDSK